MIVRRHMSAALPIKGVFSVAIVPPRSDVVVVGLILERYESASLVYAVGGMVSLVGMAPFSSNWASECDEAREVAGEISSPDRRFNEVMPTTVHGGRTPAML